MIESLVARQGQFGYQEFTHDGKRLVPGEKCRLKLDAYGDLFPHDLTGKRVLDIGCNIGFFSMLMKERGASEVIAVEKCEQRRGYAEAFSQAVDLPITLVPDIKDVKGSFDVVLMWSVYHHLWRHRKDHVYWFKRLRSMLNEGGLLLFEGPFDPDYIIDRMFSSGEWKRDEIETAITTVFSEYRRLGPSLHVEGREAWLLGS